MLTGQALERAGPVFNPFDERIDDEVSVVLVDIVTWYFFVWLFFNAADPLLRSSGPEKERSVLVALPTTARVVPLELIALINRCVDIEVDSLRLDERLEHCHLATRLLATRRHRDLLRPERPAKLLDEGHLVSTSQRSTYSPIRIECARACA